MSSWLQFLNSVVDFSEIIAKSTVTFDQHFTYNMRYKSIKAKVWT